MDIEVYRPEVYRPDVSRVNNLRKLFEKSEVISPPDCKKASQPKAVRPHLLTKQQQPSQPATAKLLPSDAIQILWLALSADGQSPVVNNLGDLEKEISKLLRNPQGLTVGHLKDCLKSTAMNKQWADKFLRSPSLKYHLEASALKLNTKTMADRFAQALVQSLPADQKPMAERHIEKSDGLQSQAMKTTSTQNILPEQKTTPLKATTDKTATEKASTETEKQEIVFPAKPLTTTAPVHKTKSAHKDELSTLATLLRVKQPETLASAAHESLNDSILTMLGGAKISMKAFEAGLKQLGSDNNWVASCLNDKELSRKFGFSGGPSDDTYSIAHVLEKHILSPTTANNIDRPAREVPKKPTPAAEVKATTETRTLPVKRKQEAPTEVLKKTSAAKEPIKTEPYRFKVEKKTAPIVKKPWTNNRDDKRINGKPFTSVQFETLDSKLLNGELLNLVPDEVLRANGWSKADIDQLEKGNRSKPLSPAALKALNFDGNITHCNGRFYGKGAFGLVKLARIQLSNEQNPCWCVAKKITTDTFRNREGVFEEYVKYEDVMREARLQTQSGCAPAIYGVANTYKQPKGRTKEHQYIVFMEQAKGINGSRFLTQNSSMSAHNKLALAKNTAGAISTSHSNNIYHGDINANNLSVDSETLKVQLLDFGSAVEGKQQSRPDLLSYGPLYLPPELVTNSYSRPNSIDREKADVYSLGVFIGETFGNGHFFARAGDASWPARSLLTAQFMINGRLIRISITHPEIASLVRDMVNATPKARPDMQEVNQRLSRIVIQSPDQRMPFNSDHRPSKTQAKKQPSILETDNQRVSSASNGKRTRNKALSNLLDSLYFKLGGNKIETFDHAMTALGLDHDTADLSTAKKAYRKKMLPLHPDKFKPVNLDGLSGKLEKLEIDRQKKQAQELMFLLKEAINRIEEYLSQT